MNVLLVIEGTYPWYRGGVSEWVFQYLTHCPAINFNILQIATDSYRPLSLESALYPIPENVVEFKRIPPPNFEVNWLKSLSTWFEEHKTEIFSSDTQSDIIHATNTGFAGWLSSRISDEAKLPLVLTEHAIYWIEVQMGAVALECGYEIPDDDQSKREIEELFQEIARIVYDKSDKLISVSESNIPFQQKLGASKVKYIPNGVESSWINPGRTLNRKPTIGWVGRCAEMKNPLQFFDFVDAFEVEEFDAEYMMLLSGANEDGLEREVHKRSAYYPQVKLIWNKSSREYYSQMDMLLITSHNESQPLVLFEALANKVLPIGRRVGDVTDTFGMTFPKSEGIRSICKNVIEKWRDQASFEKYVTERHDLVAQRHTWENIFKEYEAILSGLVEADKVSA